MHSDPCTVIHAQCVLLYGSESWVLTEEPWGKLRVFHAQCVRGMCRVNRWHTRKYKISTRVLLDRLGLESIDTYAARRQLGWLGEARRMDWKRLPRKLLSCWVGDGAKGVWGGELTYGKSVENVLRRCTHAFESESSDTTTLSALASVFVPQAATCRSRGAPIPRAAAAAGAAAGAEGIRLDVYQGKVGSWNGVWIAPKAPGTAGDHCTTQQPQQPQQPLAPELEPEPKPKPVEPPAPLQRQDAGTQPCGSRGWARRGCVTRWARNMQTRASQLGVQQWSQRRIQSAQAGGQSGGMRPRGGGAGRGGRRQLRAGGGGSGGGRGDGTRDGTRGGEAARPQLLQRIAR